ncbi:MAG: SbmA/BacA-like family transporter [Gemmataceae bacterium]
MPSVNSTHYGRGWSRIVALTVPIFRSEKRRAAIGLLALLLAFALTVSGLNVLNSYVGGWFWTALSKREHDRLLLLGTQYVGMFALIAVVVALYNYTEQRLDVFWREWLTGHLLDKYLANDAYYRLLSNEEIDNPDQRIAQDVNTFTSTTVSFLLIVLNNVISLCAFAGVLWSISPWLMLAAMVYAAFGTGMSILLGRPLVALTNAQLRKEADMRYELIRLREHAEAIALMRNEPRERDRLGQRLTAVVENFQRIIAVNRNLGCFTNGYNYLTPLIPVFIVAPIFLSGKVEFGTITQAGVAFGSVLGAFSVIISQFQAISSYVAVIARVGAIWEAVETQPPTGPVIEVLENNDCVVFDDVTILTPKEGRHLIEDLKLEVPVGTRLLITGANGCGKSALFAAAAGLWRDGQGRILRPPIGDVMFIPQKPYMMLGTLREQILCGNATCQVVSEQRLDDVIRLVRLEHIKARAGGYDNEIDWPNILSVGEQRQLALARMLIANPRYAFLDVGYAAPDAAQRKYFADLLGRSPITFITISDDPALREIHDAVLELQEEGKWQLKDGGNVKPG